MPRKITIYKGKEDISDDIELKNGKANPFGWSQSEVHYKGERIGWLESGYFQDFEDGYSFTDETISNEEYDAIGN